MEKAIDKNKLSVIRQLVSTATIEDLFYAYDKNNIQAVFLIFQNPDIRQQLHDSCLKLSLDEKTFLLGGTDPRDVADIIEKLKN